jgi:peptidoglycan/xylan/chitin deacetylase (PgdA/CDA1 family)
MNVCSSIPVQPRRTLRSALCALAVALLCNACATHDRTATVPILMYHHVQELPTNSDEIMRTWTVSTAAFESQLDWLVSHGYHTITLDQLVDQLKGTVDSHVSEKSIILTFDDGWDIGYSTVFPLLAKRHMSGTFFVYPGAIGETPGSGYMTWKQLAEMADAGMDIQSHTISHPHLRGLDRPSQEREIVESKRILESRLHRPVSAFAYPFGEFDFSLQQAARSAGYRCAVGIESGYTQRTADLFALHRIRISYGDTLDTFREQVTRP